jgi:prepilin-type N-terminal cleavage/methylation domain-containing protein
VRHPSDTRPVKPGRLREIGSLLRRRLESEEGFTLIELTIVLIILGILLTIAVPSYLSFKDRAAKTAAKADVSQTMRTVSAYAADNFPGAANDPNSVATDNGYTGITLAALATKYDANIPTVAGAPYVINPAGFTASATDFCLTAVVGRWVAAQHGPSGSIQVGTLFTPGTCTVT